VFNFNNLTVGIDCVEINRFESKDFEEISFLRKIYTRDEIDFCLSRTPSSQHFAVRFAAKEAVIKCLKPNINASLNTIEIIKREVHPEIRFLKKGNFPKIKISLSHSNLFAVAVAIAFEDEKK